MIDDVPKTLQQNAIVNDTAYLEQSGTVIMLNIYTLNTKTLVWTSNVVFITTKYRNEIKKYSKYFWDTI